MSLQCKAERSYMGTSSYSMYSWSSKNGSKGWRSDVGWLGVLFHWECQNTITLLEVGTRVLKQQSTTSLNIIALGMVIIYCTCMPHGAHQLKLLTSFSLDSRANWPEQWVKGSLTSRRYNAWFDQHITCMYWVSLHFHPSYYSNIWDVDRC